jgi:hypothetical protein
MTKSVRRRDAMRAWDRHRLANRAATLAMLAALLAMIGTVAVATAFEHSRSAAVRAASTAPLAAAAGATLWARSARAQLRRMESEESSEGDLASSVSARDADGASAVEDERKASADLLAIDEVVRNFHRARSSTEARSPPDGVAKLLARDARLDLRDGGGRQYAERSRTVHVIGDFAVVISTYEVERAEGHARGVVFIQLRLAPEGWRVHDVVARSVDRAMTEHLADPRPLRMRDRRPSLQLRS